MGRRLSDYELNQHSAVLILLFALLTSLFMSSTHHSYIDQDEDTFEQFSCGLITVFFVFYFVEYVYSCNIQKLSQWIMIVMLLNSPNPIIFILTWNS